MLSIGNIGVSQRNDSQFYLYRNALPKINLDTFDGDPKKWTEWNSRFQFMIGQAPLSSSQKIAYLQGLVKGRAKEVIQSFGCDGNYYEEAIVELKRRFGRTHSDCWNNDPKIDTAPPPCTQST